MNKIIFILLTNFLLLGITFNNIQGQSIVGYYICINEHNSYSIVHFKPNGYFINCDVDSSNTITAKQTGEFYTEKDKGIVYIGMSYLELISNNCKFYRYEFTKDKKQLMFFNDTIEDFILFEKVNKCDSKIIKKLLNI